MRGLEPPQRGREQVQAGGLDRRDAHGAGDQLRGRLQVRLGLLDACQQRVGVADERLRRRGQPQVAPDALEQRDARLLLEQRELLGDRGRAVGELVATAPIVPRAFELAQQAEAFEVEHREGKLDDTRQNFQWKRMIVGGFLVPMQQRTGALLVLASAVAFGVMPIFGKLSFEAGVGVATLLFVRFAIAAPILWAAVALRGAVPRGCAGRSCGRWRSARSATRCRPACTSSPWSAWTPPCSR